MRNSLTLVLVLSLVAGPALAGSPTNPEVEDPRGDVDVQHLVDADLVREEADASEELATSADIVQAWVDRETEEAFDLNVQLDDIPAGENLSSPLVEVWAHFTIREGDYHLAAVLSPEDGPLDASFELYEGEARIGQPDGQIHADEARLSATIPKADVRDPGEGDELSRLHVTTHEPTTQAALDYAPDASSDSLPALEQARSTDPTDLSLSADPTYGDTFAFSSFEQAPSRIAIDVTPTARQVEAGQRSTFAVIVDNDADEPEAVELSTSKAPVGWSANVQPDSLTVPAHGSVQAELTIAPADDAEGHELVFLRATGERGADKTASVSVTAIQPVSSQDSSEAGDRASEEESRTSQDTRQDSQASEDERSSSSQQPGGTPEPSGEEGGDREDEADEVALPASVLVLAGVLAAGLRAKR